MTGNVIRDKSYNFALRIVKMNKYLISNNVEYILARQLLRSGTSIGANVEDGCNAQSRKDFIHKLSIAQLTIHNFYIAIHNIYLGKL